MTKIIKLVPNKSKDEKKVKAIEFMENLIKDFKRNKLDPEKILIFAKWTNETKPDGTVLSESYDFYDNISYTENLLGCVDLLRDRILTERIET